MKTRPVLQCHILAIKLLVFKAKLKCSQLLTFIIYEMKTRLSLKKNFS